MSKSERFGVIERLLLGRRSVSFLDDGSYPLRRPYSNDPELFEIRPGWRDGGTSGGERWG